MRGLLLLPPTPPPWLRLHTCPPPLLQGGKAGAPVPRYPYSTLELPEGCEQAAFEVLERAVQDRILPVLQKVALLAGYKMQARTQEALEVAVPGLVVAEDASVRRVGGGG